ncbi:MAG TPA: hypothetical protein VG326_08335 [Tepidisphaeraceae bacterium]|jgi:hypothetical protein|nr:hypothetical protein [Tepidisphaeraceae bacterium]
MHQSNGIGIKAARKKQRAGLSAVAEKKLRGELRRFAPSEPWVDAQFFDIMQIDAQGKAVVCRGHDPGIFPPGGARTTMVRCPACGVFTPPNAFERAVCLDHAEQGNWGPSPSAVAIRALQWRNLRLPESELAPESTAALRKEIDAHRKKE